MRELGSLLTHHSSTRVNNQDFSAKREGVVQLDRNRIDYSTGKVRLICVRPYLLV